MISKALHWTKTSTLEPPENVTIETMDSQGNVQNLIKCGKLYFLEDNSMYVYYVPVFWRQIKST